MNQHCSTCSARRAISPWRVLIALIIASIHGHGMYAKREVETVPTERLIANLEKRLDPEPVESDKIRVGEEIQIRTWGLEHLHGHYTVDGKGTITLPELGAIKASGKSLAELRLELIGGVDPATLNSRAIFPEQSWNQRKGRVLPGETAQFQYELARVLSIAATVKTAQFRALKGGDRPYRGGP